MKLEVGMYVRTFEGKIFKIQGLKDELIYVSNTECYFYKSLYGGDYCFRFPNENNHYTITKASHNIIDLIEVGDYVNGCLVVKKYEECDYAEQCIKLKGSTDYVYDIHVKSIVTKQQFESMQYRIGE